MKHCIIMAVFAFFFSACSKSDNGPAPTAGFTYSGSNQYPPDSVKFTNTSTNATSYSWNFGDGGTSSEQNPTHIYTAGGNFTVTLTANGHGSANSQQAVAVKAVPTSMTITQVEVYNYPLQAPDGEGWDPTSGPDIYITINQGSDASQNIAYKSDYYHDVNPGVYYPYTGINVKIDNLNGLYGISLWDSDLTDFPPDADDFMIDFIFNPATDFPGYPSELHFGNIGNGYGVDVFVTWQ